MSEHEPREPLEVQIARKFKSVTTDALIRRIERAEDFGYDDESVELNRRLRERGDSWRWVGNKVEVYHLTDEDRVHLGIAEWRNRGSRGVIDDVTARIIASRWHDGQASSMYSFQSTGRIDLEGLTDELLASLLEIDINDLEANEELEALSLYFLETSNRDVVEGWHESTRWG